MQCDEALLAGALYIIYAVFQVFFVNVYLHTLYIYLYTIHVWNFYIFMHARYSKRYLYCIHNLLSELTYGSIESKTIIIII